MAVSGAALEEFEDFVREKRKWSKQISEQFSEPYPEESVLSVERFCSKKGIKKSKINEQELDVVISEM